MTTYEQRAAPTFADVEFRADKSGKTTFTGYAAVFDSPSKPIFDPREAPTPFVETISAGAFARTLSSGRRHTFVVDHDDKLFIAGSDGPLRLSEDTRGLTVTSPWPTTDYADNVRALHDAGNPIGMSFTFKPTKKGDQWNDTRTARRLTDVALGHVTVLASLVPAYNETTAQFRALAYSMETDVEDLEELFAAIKEGRDLSDEQKALMRKLADTTTPAVEPEPEPDPDPAPAFDPRAEWQEKFADKLGEL